MYHIEQLFLLHFQVPLSVMLEKYLMFQVHCLIWAPAAWIWELSVVWRRLLTYQTFTKVSKCVEGWEPSYLRRFDKLCRPFYESFDLGFHFSVRNITSQLMVTTSWVNRQTMALPANSGHQPVRTVINLPVPSSLAKYSQLKYGTKSCYQVLQAFCRSLPIWKLNCLRLQK